MNDTQAWQHMQELDQQHQLEEILDKTAYVLSSADLSFLAHQCGLVNYQPRKEPVMPKLSEMMPSKYLKKEDVPQPMLVTIDKVAQVSVKSIDGAEEMRWAMFFKETGKPLILNNTNLQLAALACGSDDSDDWVDKKVVLYTDPNVSFGGKVIGGLRLRLAKKQNASAAPAPAKSRPSAVTEEDSFAEMSDDLPF